MDGEESNQTISSSYSSRSHAEELIGSGNESEKEVNMIDFVYLHSCVYVMSLICTWMMYLIQIKCSYCQVSKIVSQLVKDMDEVNIIDSRKKNEN